MFIDFHCDTLMNFLNPKEGNTLYKNSHSVDFDRMKKANQTAQFFAIFMLPDEAKAKNPEIPDDDEYISRLVTVLKESCLNHSDIIKMAYNFTDLKNNTEEGKMSAFLTLEDGRAVNGSIEKLKQFYDMGIRLISLTWNFKNCFGSPNSYDKTIMNEGLTAFGKTGVEEMMRLGMAVDVSHLSDGGFWDVLNISESVKKPFLASHSNCRALSPHSRNLTDEMIKALGEAGGICGVNFFSKMLDENIESMDSTVSLIVKHTVHLRNKGGTDILALGSDLDGVNSRLETDGSDKIPLIFDALEKAGFTQDEIDKFRYKNAMRFIKDTIGG